MFFIIIIVRNKASWLLLSYEKRLSTLSLADTTVDCLYSKEFISRDTRDKMKRRGKLLSDKALREACTKVAERHSKLRELAEILSKFDRLLGQDLLEDYSKLCALLYLITCGLFKIKHFLRILLHLSQQHTNLNLQVI